MACRDRSIFTLLFFLLACTVLFSGCYRRPAGLDGIKQLNLAVTIPNDVAVLFLQEISEIYHEQVPVAVNIEMLFLEELISSMYNKSSHLCFTSVSAVTLAYRGRGRYEERGAAPIRLIFHASYRPIFLVVLRDSGIEELADLKGKRVMGLKHTDVELELVTLGFLELAGIKQDEIALHSLVQEPHALACLVLGTVDAVLVQTPLTSPSLRFADFLEKLRAIGVPEGKEEEIKAIMGPGYDTLVLEPDSLNRGEAFTALVKYYGVFAREDIPREIVYNFIKACYEKEKSFRELVSDEKTWDIKKHLTVLQTVPYHEGAVRFLREEGLWTDELAQRQEALLQQSKDLAE